MTVATWRRFAGEAAALASLLLLDVLLYRKIVRLWWTFDDSDLLRTIVSNPLLDVFVSKAIWPQQLFTPLMFVAFEGQYAMFALDTTRWYVVHLAVFYLATVALYAAVRLFLDPAPAFVSVSLFALGTPTCALITQLSTVHYFIAIIFGSLSTMAWVAALRKKILLAEVLSAAFYFAAMLAKEIAVPLPLLLLFLPAGDRRSRLRCAIGHGIALVGYFVWRRAVIGKFLGAYSWATEPADYARVLLALPWKMLRAAAGANLAVGLILIGIMTVVIASALRDRRALMLFVAAVLVAVGPILPLANDVHRRYNVMPWLVWSVAFAAAAASLRSRRLATGLLTCALLLAIVVNRQEWAQQFRTSLQMSDEARFFMEMPPNGLLRNPATPPPVMREIHWLKTVHLGKASGAGCFYDDFFLCAGDNTTGKRVWEFDPSERAVVEITSDIPRIARHHCSSIRTASLWASFEFRDEVLSWEFGPYGDGEYSALLGEGREAWQLPRRAALNLRGLNGLAVRVRYDSPQGWMTYSPVIDLDFIKKPKVTWRR